MTSQDGGYHAVWGSRMNLALAVVLLATLLVSCAGSSSSWQRPGATEDVTSTDLASCRAEAAQAGYGTVTTDDYLQRCMEAKGYRPSY
jgi:hypothetical protein